MTLSRDLFLSILSMDSYNRGYGVGVKMPNSIRKIGNAIIGEDAETLLEKGVAEASGFYGLAYDVSAAGIAGLSGTVISYRGSDNGRLQDILFGYTTGAGLPSVQGDLALRFARAVAGENFLPHEATAITVTGHSLGGGLAGYVGALYGWDRMLMDPMPYTVSVGTSYALALDDPATSHAIYGTAFPPEAPSLFSQTGGYYIPTQMDDVTSNNLATLRNILFPQDNWGLSPLAMTNSVDLTLDVSNYPVGKRHSIALNIMLMFARDPNSNVDAVWQYADQYLIPELFNIELAKSLPSISNKVGDGNNESGVLRDAIAYSALDAGERPFGDVAIRAMFDDAADFGRVLQSGALPQWLGDDANAAIGRVIVEFAGLMALRDAQRDTGEGLALNGVITNRFTDQGFLTAMRISFGEELWELGGPMHDSGERTGLVNSIVDASLSGAQLERAARWYAEKTGEALLPEIDELIFGLAGDANITPADPDGLALTLLGDASQSITLGDVSNFVVSGNNGNSITGGSNVDILLGGDGADQLNGGVGADYLVGGDQIDILDGGDNDDYLNAGDGADIVEGGLGDDRLVANLDNDQDQLRGGGGIDTIVFAYDGGNSSITVSGAAQAAVGVQETATEFKLEIRGAQTDDGQSGNFGGDTLNSIERAAVEAGRGDDYLTFDINLENVDIDYIDLGRGKDSISLSNWADSVNVDLVAGTVVLGNGMSFDVYNAENITGGDGDDSLTGNHENNTISGGEGADTLDGRDGIDRLDGGDGSDTLSGGSGNDSLGGGTGEDEIDGGDGDDRLTGGRDGDILSGGAGDDMLDGRTGEGAIGDADQLDGGNGADKFLVNNGDVIKALTEEDESVHFYGYRLTGGKLKPGTKYYVGPSNERYRRSGKKLTVEFVDGPHAGTSITINNFINGAAGINLVGEDQGPSWLERIFGPNFFNTDPLVLDLDGGGVSLTALGASNAYFDLNSNSFAERTGWVQPSDGLLALDVNQNGRIDGGTELFGNNSQNGFEVLARYDDNKDGRITNADSIWSRLLVWRDANSDGTSRSSELTALSTNDVAAIDLTPRNATSRERRVGREGNPLLAVGSYQQRSGFDAEAIAVAFRSSRTDTQFILPDGFEYDPEVFGLPNMRGYADVPDLWVAMTLDPELKAMVKALMADIGEYETVGDLVGTRFVEKQPDFYRYGFLIKGETVHRYKASAFDNILARWAGVPINDGVFTGDFDETQMRAVAEKLLGRRFVDESRLVGDLVHNPSFHLSLQTMSMGLATRFLVNWADIVENGVSADMFASGLRQFGSSSAFGTMVHEIIENSQGSAVLPAFLQRYSSLDYDFISDEIGGDVAVFIDQELQSFAFDPANPYQGWSEWLVDRLPILSIIDPDGAILDERRRAYTGNRMFGPNFSQPLGTATHINGDGVVNGTDQMNVLSAGAGNDILMGGGADDIYVFADGFGSDVVVDASGKSDEIAFQGSLTSEIAQFSYEGTKKRDLRISFEGRSETVLVKDYLDANGVASIERISFPDGLSWDQRDIANRAYVRLQSGGDDIIDASRTGGNLSGGNGNDTLLGGNILNGGTGNDTMSGLSHLISRGDGHDVITSFGTIEFDGSIESGDVDIRQLDATTFILTVRGEDQSIKFPRGASQDKVIIRFADGTEWTAAQIALISEGGRDGDNVIFAYGTRPLDGGAGNDRLTGDINDNIIVGGTGNDVLSDIFGADEFRFSLGDGHDTVTVGDPAIPHVSTSNSKTIAFSNSVSYGDLRFEQSNNGASLIIHVEGADQSITVTDFMKEMDRIRLRLTSDGTILNGRELLAASHAPTSGNDRFFGSTYSETIAGGDGNDELNGGLGNGNWGDDALDGGSGNDILIGRAGDDILIGGAGDDLLRGGVGADSHRIARGDGHDIIEFAGLGDYIEFASGITRSDILAEVSEDGNDLILRIAGESQSITLRDVMFNSSFGANEIRFASDPATTISAFILSTQVPSSGDDHIQGSYHGGLLAGGDGSDRIEGGHADETIDGGAGDDILSGGGGSNSFLFGLGSGADVLRKNPVYISSQDSIIFGPGVLPEHIDISVSADGNSIIFSIAGTNDSLTIERSHSIFRNGQFHFANNISWSTQQIFSELFGATAGNDIIVGSSSTNILEGLDGNDLLVSGGYPQIFVGGRGDDRMEGNRSRTDIYRFSLGDGHDTIIDTQNQDFGDDNEFVEGGNILEFGEGISAADISLFTYSEGAGSEGSVFLIAGTSDRIYVPNVGETDFPITEIRFADGTIWDDFDIMQSRGSGVVLGAQLVAADFDNIFDTRGAVGAIVGSGGDDIYVFNEGYGELIIDQSQSGSFVSGLPPYGSIVRFGAGISADDLTVSSNEQGDLILSLNENDRVILLRARSEAPLPFPSVTESYSGVMRFEFADGSAWAYADALNEIYWGETGRTTLTGDLFGGSFDTRGVATEIFSLSPRDTFVFNQGYGHVRVNIAIPADFDFGVDLGENTVSLGGGLSLGAASLRTTEAGDLIIDFGGGDILEFVNSIETDPNFDAFRRFGYLNDGFEQMSFATLLEIANNTAITDAISGDPDAVVVQRGDLNDQYFDPLGIGDVIDGGGGYDDVLYQRGYGELTIHIARDLGANDDYRENTVYLNFDDILANEISIRTGDENELIVDLGDGDVIHLQFERDPALDLTDRTYFLPAYGNLPLYYGGALSISFEDGTTLDGPQILALIDQNEAPLFGSGEYAAQATADISGLLTLAGEFAFSDADAADAHSISVVEVVVTGNGSGLPPASDLVNLLGGQVATEAGGANNGTAYWFFGAESSLFHYLGEGETVTLNYGLEIDDGRQGVATRNVEIMVTGTNQAPEILGGVFAATLSPNAPSLGATGEIRFADVDLAQTHTINLLGVSVEGAGSGLPDQSTLLSWLSLSAPTVAGAAQATIWSFDPGTFDFAYLGLSDRLQLTYQVEVRDASGAAITRDVTIVLQQSTLAPGALSEIDGVQFIEDNAFDLNIPSSLFASSLTGSLALTVTLADGSALPSWLSFDGTRLLGSPPSNFNGRLDLRIVASNGNASVHDFVSFEIAAANDAPIVDQILSDYRFGTGVAVDITVPANAFADVDGDALSLTAALEGRAWIVR